MRQELFDEMIGTPPESRVDVDGIVKRERRVSAARRLGGSMAAVLALAVVGGVTLSSYDGSAGRTELPRAEAAAPTADVRFRLVYDTQETADVTAKRLGVELDQALRRAAPDAKWFWEADFLGESPGPDGKSPTVNYKERRKGASTLFAASSGVSNEGRKGSLGLQIHPDLGNKWSCTWTGGGKAPVGRECTEGKTPNGAKMITEKNAGNGKPIVWYQVWIELPDNRTLTVSVGNMYGVDESSIVAQAETPLTVQQIQAIGADVGSKIKA